MTPSVAELSEAFEKLDHEPARPRYTPAGNRQRPKRTKYYGWAMEGIYVPLEVWKHFAGESDRGYYGGHGSKRLWVVYYQNEEMGKFPTKLKAQAFIWSKVDK